jgi:hypothetical protein
VQRSFAADPWSEKPLRLITGAVRVSTGRKDLDVQCRGSSASLICPAVAVAIETHGEAMHLIALRTNADSCRAAPRLAAGERRTCVRPPEFLAGCRFGEPIDSTSNSERRPHRSQSQPPSHSGCRSQRDIGSSSLQASARRDRRESKRAPGRDGDGVSAVPTAAEVTGCCLS